MHLAERIQRELTLQVTLGVPLGTVKGHVAPEVEAVYSYEA
jgi:predicted ATPase